MNQAPSDGHNLVSFFGHDQISVVFDTNCMKSRDSYRYRSHQTLRPALGCSTPFSPVISVTSMLIRMSSYSCTIDSYPNPNPANTHTFSHSKYHRSISTQFSSQLRCHLGWILYGSVTVHCCPTSTDKGLHIIDNCRHGPGPSKTPTSGVNTANYLLSGLCQY